MTVINFLAVKDGGLGVADSQESTSLRKMNTADKLHVMGKNILYGGTGPSDDLAYLHDASNARYLGAGEAGPDSAAKHVLQSMIYRINEMRDDMLQANLGISYDMVKTGTLADGRQLSQDTLGLAKQVLRGVYNDAQMAVLVGGMQGDRFRMRRVDSNGRNLPPSRPYDSIGSGADESQKVLSRYIESITREKQWEIDPQKGLVKLIEATIASDINNGVGGSPSIVHISGDTVYVPHENPCTLAADIVRGHTAGFLPRDFVEEATFDLVTNKDINWKDVDEEMFKQASDRTELNQHLRRIKKE